MERIGKRGRGIESGITADYLERLNALYAEWIEGFDLCPVLTVPADDPDFVTHLQIISERILDKLQGKEEVVFPKMQGRFRDSEGHERDSVPFSLRL